MGSHADYHYRSEADYLRLMELARDMDRNDVVIGQAVDRATCNTLQDGIKLDPKTGDAALDRELLARWQDWASDPDQCDAAGERCWLDIERMAFRSTLIDGDHFLLPMEDGSLQAIEAHRVRTPHSLASDRDVIHGVRLHQATRERLDYFFMEEEVDPNSAIVAAHKFCQVNTRDLDGVRQIFHVYNPRRVSQTRGVTVLAPVFDAATMYEDINLATLIKQQACSAFTIFVERAQVLGAEAAGDRKLGGQSTETAYPDGSSHIIEDLGPGTILEGYPGEKLTAFSPNIPNSEFFPHMKMVLNTISINLGMPVAMLLLDASDTNFSGWRGAMDQARIGFRANQRWLIERLHRPVYEWLVERWIDESEELGVMARLLVEQTGDPRAYLRHGWNAPSWPYIEPLKDASADLLRVRNCLTSPRRLHAERGRDWETIASETIEDNAFAIRRAREAALDLNGKIDDGNPVHWRELLTLPTPDGVSVQASPPAAGGDNE